MLIRVTLLLLTMVVATGCSPQRGADEPAAPAARQAADLVLTNARIYTLRWDDPAPDGTLAANAPHDANGWRPDAEAVAIRGSEIVFVGSRADASAWLGDAARVIDMRGATLLPGLVDSHTHVFDLGALLSRVNLVGVATEQEAVARVAARAREVPKGEWIIGQGWDEGAWANRYPDKRLLTEAVPDHPVFMRSLHSFAGWANERALERAGITAHTPVPSGGEMRLGADREPDGLFLNRAVSLLEDAIPSPSRAQLTRQVTAALTQMAADGYVTVHDAGVSGTWMEILETLEASDALPIRVFAMLSVRDEALAGAWLARGPDRDADSMLVTRSVKAYYDGALGSRGARLLEDYADMPGHRGVSGNEYGFDEALTAALMRAGFQVGIHAIGDAGNRYTLDFLERVIAEDPAMRDARHRIEHAQVLHPDDLPRLARLGVIASMEPPHAMEDKAWAEQRLGPDRIRGAYAWRALRASGARLIFNADNPGSDHNIFYGLHSAITRRDKRGEPPGGWYPAQALNVDEAVRAYTRWAAYAGFREHLSGVIDVGRWADLTAMDIDPFVIADTAPQQMLAGRIVLTVVGGRIVHDAR